MSTDNQQRLKKLLEIVRETIAGDVALREKYNIGQKFRFVPDRLQALLGRLEKKVEVVVAAEDKAKNRVNEDEVVVYVYLYNAQGLMLRSWENMLTPKVFYEYSVNRPIYIDKNQVESLIRAKTNKVQHAYLSVIIKREHLIESKDAAGNAIVRVKEGSLHFQNLLSFFHNEHHYTVNAEGELVKRTEQEG